jgi:hypothetical protein
LDFDVVIGKFEEFCKPKNLLFIERHRLLNMKQDGLSVEQFETKLRTQARHCGFKELTDDLTCHAFLEGVDDKSLRDKLFMKACSGDLKLDSAVSLAKEFEAAKAHLKEMEKGGDNHVHKLEQSTPAKANRNLGTLVKDCGFCGGTHSKGRCPAFGKDCKSCGGRNHFARVCNKKKQQEVKALDAYEELLMLQPVKRGRRLILELKVEDGPLLECQIDTAAARNVLCLPDYDEVLKRCPPMRPSAVVMSTYSGEEMPSMGKVDLKFSEVEDPVTFEVVQTSRRQRPLIGVESCLKLGLVNTRDNQINILGPGISSESLAEEYPEVFDGLGRIPGEYEIEIDQSITPVQHRPRRIPVMIKEDVITKIRQLESAGVVSRVDIPTSWISSLVAVRKQNKQVRICLDPKDLNRAIRRNKYPIPTIEDVLPKLEKAKCFSLLDAKDGFLQIELSQRSRLLTTFWTPIGRYCWNRMPFGLSSAPEEFQRRLHQALDGLTGIEVIADDILVYGCGDSTEEGAADHDRNLLALMERLKDRGIKINKDKMKLHLSEIKYMGHILTPDGVKPDPEKVQGIRDLPYPKDKQGVKRFMGMVTYLAKFIPGLAALSEKLHHLTRERTNFEFGQEEREAMDNIKQMVSADTSLRYFDRDKPAVVQCDASYAGLGAVLLQEEKPVAFVSRSLSEAESRYHPLELECLAVLFGCAKFDHYIYGKPDVTVLSDHQPLETIFKKTMDKSPLRLKRMLLSLQRYGIYIEYQKGTDQVLADTLSRAPRDSRYQDSDGTKIEIFLNSMVEENAHEYTELSDPRLEEVRKYTAQDEQMMELMQAIQAGWPFSRKAVPVLADYWTIKEELAVQNGLIYKGTRLIIPKEMTRRICQALHAAHQSAEAMLRRARDILFWPRMAESIQQTVEGCRTCLFASPANPSQPLLSHHVPKHPFTKVGADICYMNGKPVLVLVDYTTDYIEVEVLASETAKTVVEACKRILSRHGRPLVFHSDNAPYFTSQEFRLFADEWGFAHTTSSPYHPQSNGKAESAVKIVKRIFKVSDDPWRALMEWRNTPNRDFDSPNTRLLGRQVRCFLPIAEEHLRYAAPDLESIEAQRMRRQEKQQSRPGRQLESLRIGQPVALRTVGDHVNKWKEARVVQPLSDRSYLVESEGSLFRRNRTWLKPDQSVRLPSADGEGSVSEESVDRGPSTSPLPTRNPSTRERRPPKKLEDYVCY